MARAQYTVVEDTPELLLIQDVGDHRVNQSVTNDVENVVDELAARLGDRTLEYIDTEGQRDEIVVKNGVFSRFNILH